MAVFPSSHCSPGPAGGPSPQPITVTGHDPDPVFVHDVTVTVAVFGPTVAYDCETDGLLPEAALDHAYVYDPFPPDGFAVHVTFCPRFAGFGFPEQVTVGAGQFTVTEQVAGEEVCPADVTVIVAFFVPSVG